MNEIVSVVMSVFNEDCELLKKSIESILSQTYQRFEFIVVCDNPQNQDALSLIKKYAAEDARMVSLENSENIGLARSLNKAINIAKGQYIVRMDADDISEEDRIEKEITYLEKHPKCGLVCTDALVLCENDGHTKRMYIPKSDEALMKSLKYGSIIIHPSVAFRKDLFERVGGYNNYQAAQDYDLWLRMCAIGSEFHYINQKLLRYRYRDEGVTGRRSLIQSLSACYAKEIHNKKRQFDESEYLSYLNKFLANEEFVKQYNTFINARELKTIMDCLILIHSFFDNFVCRDKIIKNIIFSLLSRSM